ncbi:hypothetical protein N7499_002970 [Penicillium canescens]|uniref:CmcJ-like methyltransferase n=1 Tax=Penicillium canescens TaxID=5083 RepID=A0AAD6N8Z8_PENCN|nr:uncharacterized protein N7446_011858 [Penicillium canescens]KAJ6019883.1 hypothetical protein N7522_000591 [Penicillium canescens]KAJ6039202.1 hypothetical protein N7460_007234 [Penicillium canescens]KAJ6047024.1 hypothetical protein N7446_011858 [Penicillium canescens]KAJ6060885.1 hypothetical protein N7444_002739 [Penicillium canescens]KAJ6093639.1 hypothetical protein N7499_002970 [Penicillium canescens]
MVLATLQHISPLERYETEKPYFLNIAENESSREVPQTNLEYSPQDGIRIENIRERGFPAFSLQTNGFEILNYKSVTTLENPTEDIGTFCEEMARVIKVKYNAVHVFCYDYRIRKNNTNIMDYDKGENYGRENAAPPVFPVHIDHTVEGGLKRIRRHLTELEASMYLTPNFKARIINLWRPLRTPVEECPIAICDPRSIDPADLLAADRVTPDFALEVYYVKYNPNQKWFWLPNQTTDEFLVFVNYDSDCRLDKSPWMTCPHAAFVEPGSSDGAALRESVEVRLIVFTPTEA